MVIQYMTRKEHVLVPFQKGLPGCCVNGDRSGEHMNVKNGKRHDGIQQPTDCSRLEVDT